MSMNIMTWEKFNMEEVHNYNRKLRELKTISDSDRIYKNCLKPDLMHDARKTPTQEDQEDPLVSKVVSGGKYQADFESIMETTDYDILVGIL